MTEIAFLLKLMTDHKLPKSAKDLIIERVMEVESLMNSRGPVFLPNPVMPSVRGPSIGEIQVQAPPMPTRKVVTQEVVTSTGNGTTVRGPRKF